MRVNNVLDKLWSLKFIAAGNVTHATFNGRFSRAESLRNSRVLEGSRTGNFGSPGRLKGTKDTKGSGRRNS